MAPTRWLVLTVEVPSGVEPALVADRLMALGALAVEEREGSLVTHLPPPDDPEGAVHRLRTELGDTPGLEEADVSWEWQPHEEWAETWKRGLAPRRIGERLLVAPSWTEPEPRPGDLLIRIDPGMAFGTAEHATTRGCLELLEGAIRPGQDILDLGAGTGILSIAAVLLGAAGAVAVEADPFACEVARENLEINGVADRVRLLPVEIDASGLVALGPVDGIVANIQTGVLLPLLPGAKRALRSGGWLVLGGILESERREVLSAAARVELVLEGEAAEDGWWSGRFRGPPPLEG